MIRQKAGRGPCGRCPKRRGACPLKAEAPPANGPSRLLAEAAGLVGAGLLSWEEVRHTLAAETQRRDALKRQHEETLALLEIPPLQDR